MPWKKSEGLIDPDKYLFAMDLMGEYPNRDMWLGDACEECHNPNAWSLWMFDHNKQTEFELEGKHEGLECKACHTEPLKKGKKMPQECNN